MGHLGTLRSDVVWPSFGLLIAIISRPPTWQRAAIHGGLVGGTCGILFSLLLGWIVFVLTAQAGANQAVLVLAKSVWPTEGQSPEEAAAAALKIVPGVEDRPVEQRARNVSNRVFADSIAIGPKVWFFVALFAVFLAFPILYSTTIGWMLRLRGNSRWLTKIRYFAAWICITLTTVTSLAWIMGGNVDGKSFAQTSVAMKLLILVVFLAIAYLVLRTWRPASSQDEFSVAEA